MYQEVLGCDDGMPSSGTGTNLRLILLLGDIVITIEHDKKKRPSFIYLRG